VASESFGAPGGPVRRRSPAGTREFDRSLADTRRSDGPAQHRRRRRPWLAVLAALAGSCRARTREFPRRPGDDLGLAPRPDV